ncbi:hypothetical protein FAZ69_09300 [Trinickia terrae]|uniref:Magnesium transporter n=1 Tax=Trinickia terrae TaxID=2571161 RepID=A0A4U1IA14_9BURK|nr:CorA family divalent cation transporter [Trinickia terrae]TKC90322.1 hypothetical protein FAZ69_09300 [Trinickia terrae]
MLINCVVYQDGRKLADIDIADINSYVSRPECFVWVALKDPEPGELQQMQRQFGLHELSIEDAQHGHQRPKIDEYGDPLFAVPTMIAGIYGMYFQSIPELSWKYGYHTCLAVMVAIDIVLWWRFRKAGWL